MVTAKDIRQNIELFAELANHNYFIICHPYEIYAQFKEISEKIPKIKNFSFVLGGENHSVRHINMESFYFMTYSEHNVMRARYQTIDLALRKKNKPYKFLYLNGADRSHRNQLWKKLQSRGALEGSLCSYLGYGGNMGVHNCDIPLTTLDPEYESPYAQKIVRPSERDGVLNYVNFKSDSWMNQWVDGHIIPQQYIDSYFSIVTETSPDKIFCTEKIYKPILAGHPFIILGAPGTYQHLHKMGFRTFAPWIDESFDEIGNLAQRIEMIAKQIDRLCRKNLDEFLLQVQQICRHNHETYLANRESLFYKKHLELNQFIDDTIPLAEKYFAQTKQ